MNQDGKKQRAIEDKRMKELKTVRKMIEIYCKGQHRRKSGNLCESCAELMHYAEARVERCPHMEVKTFCAMCKTHCYAPAYRERIKEVMLYSCPRMLCRHPFMTILHIFL